MTTLWIGDPGFSEVHSTPCRTSCFESFRQAFPDWEALRTTDPGYGLAMIESGSFQAAVVRLPLEGWSGPDYLEAVRRADPRIPVLFWEPGGSVRQAVRLLKLGAAHYFGDPPDPRELRVLLEQLEGGAGRVSSQEGWRRYLIGRSAAIERVGEVLQLIAQRRCTVLVTGETGTGKEMVARAIHACSQRAVMPLVALNCTALPEHLLEAELFGHVKGAFTGAIQSRTGRFEQAHRGTLFLDEIGDLSLEIQAKLLRVLQEREFQRIGSSETVRVDTRVIAATNADLVRKIEEGRFREDLYYRLNVVPIHVPPLRERREDIPVLARHFVQKICGQEGIAVKQLPAETIDRLLAYSWPGNVRQLENAVEMAIALSGDREVLYPGDFALSVRAPAPRNAAVLSGLTVPEEGLDLEATVGRLERALIEDALRRTGGNKTQAAGMLKLKRTTLTAKLRSIESAQAGAA